MNRYLWEKYEKEFRHAMKIGKEPLIKYLTRYQTCLITKKHLEDFADDEDISRLKEYNNDTI
jgi:hypothetical protein